MKRFLQLVFGMLLAGFFTFLIVHQLNLNDFLVAFSGAAFEWILFGLIAFAFGYVFRIERWRIMLSRSNKSLSWQNCAGPFIASFALNNLIPFRAGDLLRIFGFNRQLDLSPGVIVATLFVERLLDLFTLLIFLGAALMLFGLNANAIAGVSGAILFLIVLGIALLLLYPSLFSPLANFIGKIAQRISPKAGIKLTHEIEKGLEALKDLARGGTMLSLLLWSLAAWIAEGGVFFGAACALPSISHQLAILLALPIGTFATLIPSTPGYIGTFDYFTIRAMMAVGNEMPASAAFALLVHFMLWLPPTIIGGLYLIFKPTKIQLNGDLRR
ncbi:COG0392 Predicted integral membrane protein [Candidatus Methylopumilus planktonicus]|uniref:lysylphosphatidylglycerol synthase transmembrane domain-containing protein n=1 Tax=Candidatus Methylopumilus planktonicus TaxID=1581557 RepID=UPI003BEF2380